MVHLSTQRRFLRGPGSLGAGAIVAALVLLIAMPGVAAAWNSYSFSTSEASNLLTLMNQWRAANGKGPLVTDSTLTAEAQKRSKDMYDRNYFSHNIPPDGHTVFTELTNEGYCFSDAGENIGWNNYPDDQTTSVLFNGWKNSAPHNANMLGSYTVVGIGAFKGDGRDAGSGPYSVDTSAYPVHIFTAVFATPCGAKPTPTPTPRPTATPRPTPTPTPRPTGTPRPTPTPTPRPTGTPHPTATPQPTPTPAATPEATPTGAATDSPGDTGSAAPSFEASPSPSDEPSAEATFDTTSPPSLEPSGATGPSEPASTTGAFGLQVLEPLPNQDLLDAIVGGVASSFFGH